MSCLKKLNSMENMDTVNTVTKNTLSVNDLPLELEMSVAELLKNETDLLPYTQQFSIHKKIIPQLTSEIAEYKKQIKELQERISESKKEKEYHEFGLCVPQDLSVTYAHTCPVSVCRGYVRSDTHVCELCNYICCTVSTSRGEEDDTHMCNSCNYRCTLFKKEYHTPICTTSVSFSITLYYHTPEEKEIVDRIHHINNIIYPSLSVYDETRYRDIRVRYLHNEITREEFERQIAIKMEEYKRKDTYKKLLHAYLSFIVSISSDDSKLNFYEKEKEMRIKINTEIQKVNGECI